MISLTLFQSSLVISLERIKRALPNFYDTPDVVSENFRLIRAVLNNASPQVKQTEAGT